MLTFTNPYTPGTPAHDLWEETGTKTLAPELEPIVSAASAAYDRQDQAWFDAQTTDTLATLWTLVSGVNTFTPAGAWDDEVHDALDARCWFMPPPTRRTGSTRQVPDDDKAHAVTL